jgi:predicted TIM-barrel fold metal-dependent hydrolase
MSQIAGLITSGVFDTFPELKVVVMEGGFTLPPI